MENPQSAPYHPYYCEENIWHLAGKTPFLSREAVVVIAIGAAMWHQRAAARPELPIVWDYHVFLFARLDAPSPWQCWDLDTALPLPCDVATYLRLSFRSHLHAGVFRVMSAADYRLHLASDRSHMRDQRGHYRQPPPPWPPIGSGHTLPQLIDPSDHTIGGALLRLTEVQDRFAR